MLTRVVVSSTNLQFLKDYATLYDQIGGVAFRVQFGPAPVLIGIKLVASLDEEAAKVKGSAYSTIVTGAVLGKSIRPQSIVGRVFWLKRRPGSRVSTRITVGRFGDRDLMLPDHSISRTHCVFDIKHGGAVTLEDLGSRNGTEIDDEKLEKGARHRLKGGELLTLGRIQLRYRTHAGFMETLKAMSKTL